MKGDTKNQTKKSDSEPVVTDFGTRAINRQNFSRTVVIPKTALINCGNENITDVKVELVQNGDEKFLKLTPVRIEKGSELDE